MGGPAMTSGGSAGLAASFLYRNRAAESIWSVCTEICVQLHSQHVLLGTAISELGTYCICKSMESTHICCIISTSQAFVMSKVELSRDNLTPSKLQSQR